MKTPVRQLLEVSLKQKKIKIMEYYASYYDDSYPCEQSMLEYLDNIGIEKMTNAWCSFGTEKESYNAVLHAYFDTFKLLKMLDEGASDDDIIIAKMTN